MGKLKADDILDALRAEMKVSGRPAGEGWRTIQEMVTAYLEEGKLATVSSLAKLLTQKISQGMVERQSGSTTDPMGAERRVWYYRMVPK